MRREEELKDVEQREEASFRELAVLKEQVFKQSQSLFNLRKEESQMIADIATSQVLFCAVWCGALGFPFQRVARQCQRTVLLFWSWCTNAALCLAWVLCSLRQRT